MLFATSNFGRGQSAALELARLVGRRLFPRLSYVRPEMVFRFYILTNQLKTSGMKEKANLEFEFTEIIITFVNYITSKTHEYLVRKNKFSNN